VTAGPTFTTGCQRCHVPPDRPQILRLMPRLRQLPPTRLLAIRSPRVWKQFYSGCDPSNFFPRNMADRSSLFDRFDRFRGVFETGQNNHSKSSKHTAQQGVVDKNKRDWKLTLSATAKLLLRGVRDSADAFGPLKSVAGGLCFILENCEVRPPSRIYCSKRSQSPQQMEANQEEIESLAPRVQALSALLCAPVSNGDAKEGVRRNALRR